jgi:hypothetical protein
MDTMIDPNEELDYFVGKNVNEAQNLLVDLDVEYRIWKSDAPRDTMDLKPNRVNLRVDWMDNVVKAYYG